RILSGTGFTMRKDPTGAIGITRSTQSAIDMPAMTLAQAAPARAAVETVTVTSSKLGGADVQSIPISITAMSQEQLDAMKIEGGPDLLKNVPNMSFTKTNFSGYNIQIRGIGTQAVSVTTDPAVAVALNDTPFLRNHFFEQEFFDVQSVEVLRGPQGTLYGRNATAGVVNVISAKPTDSFEAMAKVELGNFASRRFSGMLNIPVYEDKLDVRLAGAWTKRSGYDYNLTTGNRVNGRDLWSTRLTVGFKPVEWFHGNVVWEHFSEDDNRSRTGKQLCTRDPGPSSIGAFDNLSTLARASMSQGCLPGSLYSPEAFGTPNGLSIPFIYAAAQLGPNSLGQIGFDPDTGETVPLIYGDPYGGMMQSPDLHAIASIRDPKFRARNDVLEANIDVNITPELTLTSQSGYNTDIYYSTQDYNRFDTVPVFNDSNKVYAFDNQQTFGSFPITPGGVFCDPQIGCSSSIAGFDISQAKSWQFSQELRLSSSFNGPLNFSLGSNYTHYRTVEDYYVLFNVLTALAEGPGFSIGNQSVDPTKCKKLSVVPIPIGQPQTDGCIYIDTNPLSDINGQGHNYFRSENPYTLNSWADFGEIYYRLANDLKLTAGLRYTHDEKVFTPVPTQVLLAPGLLGGTVNKGYPSQPDIVQRWGEVTGRLVGEWSPKLDFTDQSMFYASYSRGYKGGGANPPGIGYTDFSFGGGLKYLQVLPYPATFEPEFVNAYEIGTKNTLLDGALVLNGDAFFYDYKDYQISQIKSRTAVNENFSAHVWGTELEGSWEPIPGLRFNFSGGYENSRVGDNQYSLDMMDRIQGHDDYTIMKPWVQLPDNCVVLKSVVEQYVAYARDPVNQAVDDDQNLPAICPGTALINALGRVIPIDDSAFPNGGLGFPKNVGGNELPNTPHFTFSFGAQYAMPITSDWTALVRSDVYWQDSQYARIYNDNPYDVIHEWSNVNVSVTFVNSDGWQLEAYIKNIRNTTAITGTFLNSDDTALTTNIFTTDPRLIGFSLTKNW
ncbi:MAG TPA: TonB-dependent receptor, partial [Terriglobales bacterium]|nr:TonB-dependent receptor [Terriglobales bacterium]